MVRKIFSKIFYFSLDNYDNMKYFNMRYITEDLLKKERSAL